ncbi:MAG: hypothetical protein QMD78_03840, partial [Methanocellales archaeon]|nr:hypothetical protein [Methanocellales archaeon]
MGSIESETDVDALFGVKSRGFRPTKPPEIGGWVRFHKRQSLPEHDVPFFFGFTPCVSVGHSEVNGTVLDVNKAETKTPAIVIHRIGRGMTAWISSNLFESVGYLLAGGEATLQEDREMRMDEYGRIPGINSVMYKYGLVNIPLVNEYEAIIWNIICRYNQITGVPGVKKWLWPYGKSFAMFSSHDVDHFLQPPHLLLLRSLRDLLHLKIKKGLIQLLLSMLYLPGSMGYFYGRADLLKFIPT